jgi:hypothetical protein
MENRGPGRDRHVEIDIDGKRYVGRCSVESGGVSVSHEGVCKATQIGDSSIDVVARMLLREPVEESLRQK